MSSVGTGNTARPGIVARLLGGNREYRQELVVLAVTVLVVIVLSATISDFLSLGSVLTMARNSAILGILALAMGVVVVFRGLDLSLVSVMSVSTSLALTMVDRVGPFGALVIGGLAAVVMGLFNGFIIAFVEIPALFATLATSILFYGVARIIWLQSLVVQLPDEAGIIREISAGRVLGVPRSFLVFAVLCLFIYLALTRTRFGRFVYAHGDNPATAALTGIPTRPMTLAVYAVSSVLGYVAGLVTAGTAGNLNSQLATASPLTFQVLAVVVIGGVSLVGGRGGVQSILVGTLLVAVLTNGMILLDVNQNVQTVVQGLVLLCAIVLDTRLHKRDEETARQGE